MENVLITGGAGFIGSHTADALLKSGFNVRILSVLDPQIYGNKTEFPMYMNPSVECIKGDVRVAADVNRALDGILSITSRPLREWGRACMTCATTWTQIAPERQHCSNLL